MEEKQLSPDSKKKNKTAGSGFIFYAVFVFAALAAGLIVIIMRSHS
jgi:hypothetical protein